MPNWWFDLAALVGLLASQASTLALSASVSTSAAQATPVVSGNLTSNGTGLEFYPITCGALLPRARRVLAEDCHYLFDNIIESQHGALDLVSWSYVRDERTLPADGYFRWQSCAVIVDNVYPLESDVFSLIEVSLTAKRIVQQCVASLPSSPIGGVSSIGQYEKHFHVHVVNPASYLPPNFVSGAPREVPSTVETPATYKRDEQMVLPRIEALPESLIPSGGLWFQIPETGPPSIPTPSAFIEVICGQSRTSTITSSAGAGSSASPTSTSTGTSYSLVSDCAVIYSRTASYLTTVTNSQSSPVPSYVPLWNGPKGRARRLRERAESDELVDRDAAGGLQFVGGIPIPFATVAGFISSESVMSASQAVRTATVINDTRNRSSSSSSASPSASASSDPGSGQTSFKPIYSTGNSPGEQGIGGGIFARDSTSSNEESSFSSREEP